MKLSDWFHREDVVIVCRLLSTKRITANIKILKVPHTCIIYHSYLEWRLLLSIDTIRHFKNFTFE